MSAPLLKKLFSVAVLLALSHTSSALVQTNGRSRRLRSRARATGDHVPIAETKPESIAPQMKKSHRRTTRRSLEGGIFDLGNGEGEMHISDTQIQYFQYCRRELLSEDVLGDGMISQNDFARKLSAFCQEFDVDTVAGHACPEDRYSSLPAELQLTFAFAVCPAEDGKDEQMECLEKLDSLNGMGNDFGYIVTNETMPEVEYDVEELCFGIFPYLFPPPPTESPTMAPTSPSESPSAYPTGAPSEPKGAVLDLSDKRIDEDMDLPGSNKHSFQPPVIEDDGEDGIAVGPIVGIALGGLAFILGGLIILMRRRNSEDYEDERSFRKSQPIGAEYGEDSIYSGRSRDMKVLDGDYSASKHTSTRSAHSIAMGRSSFVQNRAKISADATFEKINDAIDNANWNEVYTLASEMAEHEDLSTLSSRQSSNRSAAEKKLFKSITYTRRSRTGLSNEDLERTQTLDDLVEMNDWTGLAVTAALYAGESASRRGDQKRSIFDRMTGKRTSSRAAAAATAGESSSIPYGNALGSFTDETKSGSSADGHVDELGNVGSFDKGGYSSSTAKLAPLRKAFDEAVQSADWSRVLELAKEFEANTAYQANVLSNESVHSSTVSASCDDEESCITLHERLNQAVSQSDWPSVNIFATKMNEIYSNKGMSSSTALVPVQPSPLLDEFSVSSIDTNGDGSSKKQTIEKLIRAGKWKGASIMAGIYDMESKGSLAPSYTDLTVSAAANNGTSSWASMLPSAAKPSPYRRAGGEPPAESPPEISAMSLEPDNTAVELKHSDRVTGTIPSMSSGSRRKQKDYDADDGDSTLISMM